MIYSHVKVAAFKEHWRSAHTYLEETVRNVLWVTLYEAGLLTS